MRKMGDACARGTARALFGRSLGAAVRPFATWLGMVTMLAVLMLTGDTAFDSVALAACVPTSSGTGGPGVYNGTTASIVCDGASDTITVNAPASTGAITLGDGNDTATVNGGTTAAISAGNGNDKVTINPTATFTGNVSGQAGNDLIVINGGTSGANFNPGTGATSVNDTDRMFMFGGTFSGSEAQVGSGKEPFFFFMGGSILEDGGGSLEINRGSQNAVLVFDGGTLATEEGIEVQNGNAGLPAGPKNPTIYFRSGLYEAEELELGGTDNGGGNPTNWNVVIDPINSKDPAYFQNLATNATNGGDATLSTANLNADLFSAPANPNADHQMVFKTEEITFGAGNDVLTFNGAVNNGEGQHNLVLQGEEEAPGEFEITELGGGLGVNTLNVGQGSNLILGEVADFQFLNVRGGSLLTMTAPEYNFGSLTPGSGHILVEDASTLIFEEEDDPIVTTDTVTVTEASTYAMEGEVAQLFTNSILVEEDSLFEMEGGEVGVEAGEITVWNSTFRVEGEEVEVEVEDDIEVVDSQFLVEGEEEAEVEADDISIVRSFFALAGGELNLEAEEIEVLNGSTLGLFGENANVEAEEVLVDGTSVLHVGSKTATLNVEHFELGAPSGGGGKFKPSSQYAAFNPGGMLFIGAPLEDDEEAEEEGDEEAVEVEEEAEEEEEAEFGRAKVRVNTGAETFVNGGTINMINGVTGDQLAIFGPYQSNGGNLALDTQLGTKKSDQLVLNGPVTGTTTVYVNNSSERPNQKAKTVVIAESPTNSFSGNSFKLGQNAITGKREVLDGAFAYRLASNNSQVYLYGDLLEQVPGYVTSPSVAQQHVLAEYGTLYQRMGEMRNYASAGQPYPLKPEVWVRGSFSQKDVTAQTGWDFDYDNQNLLFGVDPGGWFGLDTVRVGFFAGYGNTDSTVKARTFGRTANSTVDINGWTEGIYVTYFNVQQPGVGFYFDGIVKANQLDVSIRPWSRAVNATPDTDSFSGSGEIGYGIGFGNGWSLTPQGQLIGIEVSESSFTDAFGVNVSVGESTSVIGRLGLQLQDSIATAGGGVIAPYLILNVYSNFDGSTTSIVSGTSLTSDIGGTWGTIGGGLTASLGAMWDVYGSTDYAFGDVQGWNGTVGLRAHW